MSKEIIPYAEASKVTQLAPGVFLANLSANFCIGSVPNGGYVASTIIRAAAEHLASRGQTDSITSHFEFIDRTEPGPALIILEDVKLGRSVSTLHATLYQNDLQPTAPFITPRTRKLLLSYLTNASLAREQGLTLDTQWTLTPPPAWSTARLTLLATEAVPGSSMRSACFFPTTAPRRGQEDVWLRLASGERLTNAVLAYIVDSMPYLVEGWRPAADEPQTPYRTDDVWWYPTLVLNLDIKRGLPAEGVEWLFMRTMAREIRNGRFDLEVTILDEQGNLVALASHVNMILSMARNMKKRTEKL
ncbi:uncharacterized protein VDAG_07657 [Verticillium dahliae VdLs.17]|uniref:Thioesterase family protein n=1 Tax=Verticillium dahliae (strain VdLs.17 / ATCC MYA-4575 / FGSC 10137) TaxID=498257 RepID=G2XBX5_VERDV|nr:uncharacterized protein VDAG_07657 [Verticillium dahliae VdLs.17]EGY16493.1 hypothetical protein VDAG_07657 [Verticillium dahliae VdLs.17]